MMKRTLLAFVLLCFTSLSALAEWTPGDRVATFTASLDRTDLRPGENLRLTLSAEMEPGWHIYSVKNQGEDAPPPSRLEWTQNQLLPDGPLYETKPLIQEDKAIGLILAYHQGQARFYQNFLVPDPANSGPQQLQVAFHYQACDDRICLPPAVETLNLDYQIELQPARAEYLSPLRSIETLPQDSLAQAKAGGFWAFLGLAALMGLASLLTPCVFPMVPITVSYFSKQSEGSHRRLMQLSFWFTFGIVATYTGMGLIMASLFGAGAALQIATNPWVNLVIAGLFILFAFSLIGFFEIRLPSGLEDYFDHKARALGGVAGVILMGFTFTLTAFTCTVQFVGTLLIAAAAGEWLWPLAGMLVFSSVFAFPFFLLALSPGLIRKMQGQSGEWLGRTKVVLGILELMASLKFLSNADLVWQTQWISRDINLYLWIALLLTIVLYLGLALKRSGAKYLAMACFTLLAAATAQGLGDKSLGSLIDSVLPPPAGLVNLSGDFASREEIEALNWQAELAPALELAQSQHKRVFIEFTGYTCVNCRWMEQNLLARQAVHQRLRDDFILVRLYTDGGPQKDQNMQLQIERFQTVALPLYVTLDAQGHTQKQWVGIAHSVEEFLDFLNP